MVNIWELDWELEENLLCSAPGPREQVGQRGDFQGKDEI